MDEEFCCSFRSECGARCARVVPHHDGVTWVLYVNERDASGRWHYYGDNWRGAKWAWAGAVAAAKDWCAGGDMPAMMA